MTSANNVEPNYIEDFIDDCLNINDYYFMEYTDEDLKIKNILNNDLTESEARIFLLYIYFNNNISKLSKYLNSKYQTTLAYVRRVEKKILQAYDN